MKKKLIKIIFITFTAFFLFSCSSGNNAGKSKPTQAKPELVLAEVSSNNCLNVEKVMAQLQDPTFQYPASVMTTDLKTLSGISASQSQFYSYTNFYYKTGMAADLNLMAVAHQNDCDSVQILTSSREVLNFKVTDHSDTHLRLELTDSFNDAVSAPKRDALSTRFQPYSYIITYVDQNNLKIVERYRTLDVLCATNDTVRFEVTKFLSWSTDASKLPQSYEISSEYLATVKATLATPVAAVEEPVSGSTAAVSLQNIKDIMATPIREELKLCN